MKKVKLFVPALIAGAFSFFNVLHAQVETVVTREFEAEDWLSSSLNLKTDGVLIYGWEDRTTFVMKALDTQLNDYSKWSMSTNKGTTLADIDYSSENSEIYILMRESKRSYSFTTIDLQTKRKKTSTLEIPKGTSIRNTMYLVGEEVWLVGFTKKEYFMYHFKASSPRLTPLNTGISEEKFTIEQVNVLENDEVSIGYFYGPKKAREFDVTVLNSKGKTVQKSLLSSVDASQRKLIIDASVTRLGDADYAITGTYNKKGKGIGNGVYFARFEDNKVGYLSNFDYSDFEHFFDYLSDKQRDKINSKIDKKKDKGKEVTVSHLSVSHKTQVSQDGLVFVSEFYHPTYRYETTYVNGKPTTTRVFDGYQYTHAIAVGIDNNGTKLYDLHIPMHVYTKPYYVTRFLRLNNDTLRLTILHTAGRRIYSSEISGSDITNNEYEVINEIKEGEKEKWSASNGMYWYKNYFFIMETQKTKEKGLVGKKKIKFYATKVEVL